MTAAAVDIVKHLKNSMPPPFFSGTLSMRKMCVVFAALATIILFRNEAALVLGIVRCIEVAIEKRQDLYNYLALVLSFSHHWRFFINFSF